MGKIEYFFWNNTREEGSCVEQVHEVEDLDEADLVTWWNDVQMRGIGVTASLLKSIQLLLSLKFNILRNAGLEIGNIEEGRESGSVKVANSLLKGRSHLCSIR